MTWSVGPRSIRRLFMRFFTRRGFGVRDAWWLVYHVSTDGSSSLVGTTGIILCLIATGGRERSSKGDSFLFMEMIGSKPGQPSRLQFNGGRDAYNWYKSTPTAAESLGETLNQVHAADRAVGS